MRVSDMTKLKWQDMPHGACIAGGTAFHYETGDWRNKRPIFYEDRCTHCLICWIYCPDSSILVKDGKMIGIDYEHCKGCGICARECPPKANALEMVSETEVF